MGASLHQNQRPWRRHLAAPVRTHAAVELWRYAGQGTVDMMQPLHLRILRLQLKARATGPGAPRHTIAALASSFKRRRRPWLLHNTNGASICSTRMCRRETSNPGSRSRRHERASTSLGYQSEEDAESGFAGPAGATGIAHSVTHARGHGPPAAASSGGHRSSCSVCLLHSQCPGVRLTHVRPSVCRQWPRCTVRCLPSSSVSAQTCLLFLTPPERRDYGLQRTQCVRDALVVGYPNNSRL